MDFYFAFPTSFPDTHCHYVQKAAIVPHCRQKKFPARRCPAAPFTAKDGAATRPINRLFPPPVCSHGFAVQNGNAQVHIYTGKQLPHYAAVLQARVKWPVICVRTAKSYSSGARLILCKPFNWIAARRKPVSYFCMCSSARPITHLSVPSIDCRHLAFPTSERFLFFFLYANAPLLILYYSVFAWCSENASTATPPPHHPTKPAFHYTKQRCLHDSSLQRLQDIWGAAEMQIRTR